MRARPTLPAGHGEVLTQPDVSTWPELLVQNRAAAAAWDFEVAGLSARELRDSARREALEAADRFSSRVGLEVGAQPSRDAPIVVTGHQPELFHPGVWAKYFLMQRVAREAGAVAVDLVVDSDGFDAVALTVPCARPEPQRCTHYLVLGAPGSCYATTPPPDERTIAEACTGAADALRTLAAPALVRHLEQFCGLLRSASRETDTIAEALTVARRRYEAPAGTDYLELPVTAMSRTRSFTLYVADMLCGARRFADAYNAALQEYRALARIRTRAQPVPDLEVDGSRVELPLWELSSGVRRGLTVEETASGLVLRSDGQTVAELAKDPQEAAEALLRSGLAIAPKALALTAFVRTFVADLFIHGVGGGRYDRVTDGVIRNYYGVEPLPYVVGSLTLYLPLGLHVVGHHELEEAVARLKRIEHNPDDLLDEAEFDSAEERRRARELAAQKAELIERIARPGADKRALGERIRAVNAELAELLEPLRRALESRVDWLTAQRKAAEVLTDRTYPYCLWDPIEVADKLR